MSRFNTPTKESNTTTNYEGEKAYKLSPELKLYTAVCCASLQPEFYTPKSTTELSRLQHLLQNVSPQFIAHLASYARNNMNLRSVPLVLAVELTRNYANKDSLVSKMVEDVIQRADEITEILAYYQFANNRTGTKKLNKLSKQLQKGIRKSFKKFSEYQFAKYNRKTEITFKDAIFLTHPSPNDFQDTALPEKIINDTLETPYTWEVELSEAGQKGKDKKVVWEELIDSKKVGYMALLRNLRNILQAEVSPKHIEQVCNYLSNQQAVQKSRQLPFRFLSAYRELQNVQHGLVPIVLEALEQAIVHSICSLEGFGIDTSVLIAADVSASMQHNVSPKSSIQNYDIGLLLGMMLQSKCKNVITGFFGDDWKVVQLPRTNILANTQELHRREGEVGYGTNGWKVIDWLIQSNKSVDKVMIFTDCQLWDSTNTGNHISALWNTYKQTNPQAKLYLFDLTGYGNTPLDIRAKDVNIIAGWSDKIFNVLANIEKGDDAVKTITEYQKEGIAK